MENSTNKSFAMRTERRKARFMYMVIAVLVLTLTFHIDCVLSDENDFGEENFDSPTHVKALTPDDRGYRDVVIAIKDDVREEDYPSLLADLKEAMRRASSFMYRATKSLAYFKTVRILLPPSWLNGTDVATATWERYDTSDIRIAPANENFPYTEKFTGCGLPGRFISLTPRYITNGKVGLDALHDIYGTPNKVIVHEWGHFRWGLFDEYPRYNSFYQDLDTGKVEATRCVKSIPGEIRNIRTGKPCGVSDYNSDGLPDSSKCVFFDDMEAKTYSASIMYKQYLSNNEQFCDNPLRPGVPDTVAHNPMAPNEQNTKCQQRSAWEVLRAHPDFENTDSLDPRRVPSTDPEFIIVRQKEQTTTVLVLDVSGSMDGERLVLLQQAAANIIENILPLGSRLSIIAFNEYATVLHDIVEIDTPETRESLLRSLPRSATGRTSIGSGVELAVKELREYESDPAGSTLIVITDGEQNAHPFIQDVLHQIDNMTVNTVAVGGEADGELELLAAHTGGDSFSHTDQSSEIYLSFFKAAASQMSQSQVTDAVIDADFIFIPMGQTFTNKFHLDDALTGGLKITIAYIWTLRPEDVFFLLIRPDGLVFHTNSVPARYTVDRNYKQVKINLRAEDVVPGEWTLNVTNNGSFEDDFNIVIQPRVKEGTTPILATAHWAVPSVTPPNRQILFVTVQQGDTPVVEAEVKALVRLNANAGEDNIVTILPHDDGIGADITKDDGIYSAYFTSFLGKGRHGVEVFVRASHETKLIKGALVGYGAASNPAFSSEERTIVTEYTGDFQREITGGSFECTTTDCGNSSIDLYPPGRITDLSVARVHTDFVVLRFSSPGDDLATGNASKYEVRYSSNFTQITKEFQDSNIVPLHWITDATQPKPAGAVEELTILLNYTEEKPLIFSIVAIDDANNRGERSNLVTVRTTSTTSTVTVRTTSTTSTATQPQTGLAPGAIAGVVLSMILLLLCLLIIGLFFVWRKTRSPSKAQCNGKHPVSV